MGVSSACCLLDGQQYDELEMDEDLLDDEAMDDMFSVDLGDNMSAAFDALVSGILKILFQYRGVASLFAE